MRVNAAFSRLLRLDGVWVRQVSFEDRRVVVDAALHRAAQIATEPGMDVSLTAAANHALAERVRAFARRQALTSRLRRFPEDRPPLAAVALRRVRGSGHPAESQPDLVQAAAEWIERRDPDWVLVDADGTVDLVLRYGEMIAEGVGMPRTATA